MEWTLTHTVFRELLEVVLHEEAMPHCLSMPLRRVKMVELEALSPTRKY